MCCVLLAASPPGPAAGGAGPSALAAVAAHCPAAVADKSVRLIACTLLALLARVCYTSPACTNFQRLPTSLSE